MSRTIHAWLNNEGAVVFKASSSFSRTAERVLNAMGGARPTEVGWGHVTRHAHMRMGHYGVTICAHNVIAARVFPAINQTEDGQRLIPITRKSKFWANHCADRLSQISVVERYIKPTHPHYDGIMADINHERAQLTR